MVYILKKTTVKIHGGGHRNVCAWYKKLNIIKSLLRTSNWKVKKKRYSLHSLKMYFLQISFFFICHVDFKFKKKINLYEQEKGFYSNLTGAANLAAISVKRTTSLTMHWLSLNLFLQRASTIEQKTEQNIADRHRSDSEFFLSVLRNSRQDHHYETTLYYGHTHSQICRE